jgi:uncharacterized radical SAM superfamily protein
MGAAMENSLYGPISQERYSKADTAIRQIPGNISTGCISSEGRWDLSFLVDAVKMAINEVQS